MFSLKYHRVVFVAICANIANFSFGTCLGWTSPIMPKLRDHTYDSPLSAKLTKAQEGWISSCISVGALTFSLAAGQVGWKIGKKLTIFLGVVLIEVSYIILLFGTEVWIIIFARFTQGIAGGLIIATVPMYIGEIAPDNIRGALGSLMTLFVAGGTLYAYSIGPFVDYKNMQFCCQAIPVIFFGAFIFVPETPYYLAKKGRTKDLLKSLEFLRGHSGKTIEDEMNSIVALAEADKRTNLSTMDIFRNKGYVKALLIISGLLAFQQFNGNAAITFNSQTIFDNSNSNLDPAIATIILGLTRLVASFLTPFIIEKSGRRIILLMSAFGMSVSLFALGAFFYIQAFGDVSAIMWIPVPALFIFNISYSFGFGPVPWAILGEILPSNVKPIAASLASTTSWLTAFLMTRWFPELNAIGTYYVYFLFDMLAVVSIFFIIFCVIETKGLSIDEIQEKLLS